MKTHIIIVLLLTVLIYSQVTAQTDTGQVVFESVEWNDDLEDNRQSSFDTTFYSGGRRLVSGWKKDIYGRVYIAMWNNKGEQILDNGEGYYYEYNYITPTPHDSIIYEIRDSLKNGSVQTWKYSKEKKDYYLYESAVMDKNQLIGFIIKYYPSGKIKYVKGPIGENYSVQGNYDNGNLKFVYSKVNYNWEGVAKHWNEDGVLIKEVNYHDDNKIGRYREYHDNGKIKIDGQYVLEFGRVTYENMDEYGDAIYVDTIEETGVKDGIWKTYDESGDLQSLTTYVKGTRIGVYKEYHANGKVKMEGDYVAATISVQIDETNDERVNENEINQIESDVRDGIWNYYNVNGILISRKIYEQGTLIREDDFDMN